MIKEVIQMEWIEQLNEAIKYIEDSLSREIEIKKSSSDSRMLHISFPADVFLYSRCTFSRVYQTKEDDPGSF